MDDRSDHGHESGDRGAYRFHYNREERLKKRHIPSGVKRGFLFSRRRRRGLIILIVDLLLIALVLYYLNRPTNVYLEQKTGDLVYELNVTSMRGKKILIGFTIKNSVRDETLPVVAGPVTLVVTNREGQALTFTRHIENGTNLKSGESSSTIFLLGIEELPDSGLLELYYTGEESPLFSKRVRF
jgi:hypothetical protein